MVPYSKKVVGSNPPDWGLQGSVRLIGDTKLPVGMNVSGCLASCVSPATAWQGYTPTLALWQPEWAPNPESGKCKRKEEWKDGNKKTHNYTH